MRTISALFQTGEPGGHSVGTQREGGPLEARVASISAELAAAIAQAQSRVYVEKNDDDEDGFEDATWE